MKTEERLKALADKVTEVIDTERNSQDSVMLLCSGKDESLFLLAGVKGNLFKGLLETMIQKEDMAKFILDLAATFLQMKEDDDAVEDLINKTLN